MPELQSLIAAIPPLAGATVVRQLSEGPVNRSWLLNAKESQRESQLVLRVDAPLAARLGLHRRGELTVLDAVSAAGFGPEVVWADPDHGLLLTRYVPGQHWGPGNLSGDLKVRTNLERLGRRLKQLHELPPTGPGFEPDRIASGYAKHIGTTAAAELAGRVGDQARVLYADSGARTICHNDLNGANIIECEPPHPDSHSDSLAFIDWEYAAVGDPCFDLAVIACENRLGTAETRCLLEAWSGSATPGQESRLEAFCQLYLGLARLWRLVVDRPPVAKAPPEPGPER